MLATLIVTSTVDAVDLDPGDGVCEISSGGPCTLRAAIQEANALPNTDGPDQIVLPKGIYTLSLGGIDDQQSLTGDLDISSDLVLQGAGAADTIIDAGGIDRVIDIGNGSVVINDVTIRGGVLEDDEVSVESSGGGIRNEGDLTLNQSRVTGNIAAIGAGVANYNGTLRISRSVISGNGDSTTVRGGGVANYSNYDPASLEITDTTITNNRANTGGGVNNHAYDGIASSIISRSTISGNTAQNGGGISNRSVYYYSDAVAAKLTIRGSTISGNVADFSGGGIHAEANDGSESQLDLAGSTITANAATSGSGGGITNVASAGASTTLESVILSGNTAGGVGPDLFSESTAATFSLIETAEGHSVIDGNSNNIVGKDPQLTALEDNGGPTLTHLLLAGSPAIDQGSNSNQDNSDQRGTAFSRTVDDPSINNAGDGTDIGAVEVGQVAAIDDFGDAPEAVQVGGTLRRYPTQLASDGARHRVTSDGPSLGTLAADVEQDGQSTVSATGDDSSGLDDEDSLGTAPIVLTPGSPLTGLSISHTGGSTTALLSAWIDLNLDGDWDDSGEQILTDVLVPADASTTPLDNITLPSTTPSGTTFIRVRISTQSGLTPRGEAPNGEVEDFAATVGTPPPQFADLSLIQSVDDANPVLGQDVTFTITVSNDGPERATNVEVSDFLPFDLSFVSSSVSQGAYDDLDGIWLVGGLNAGASAVLNFTATVDSSDPITHTAEVTASDQMDPDSTPGNDVSGEDDQVSIVLGTCLTAGPIHVGVNRLTFSCATPGSFSAFVRGTQRGSHTFSQYGATVDIADAEEIAIAIADSNGVAVAFFDVTDQELSQTTLVQAFEMIPNRKKSNTLSLESTAQMLRSGSIGQGGPALQPESLNALIDAVITGWESAGISSTDAAALRAASVIVSDLPFDSIGRVIGETIVLDADAAGNGWFIDNSPWDDQEFSLDADSGQHIAIDSAASGRVDLVTALTHEFGHLLGLPDLSDPNSVMHDRLDVGVRRLPTANTNVRNSFDVNDDGIVSALDALVIINRLNRASQLIVDRGSVWVGADDGTSLYLDANADFSLSSLDALLIINHLSVRRAALPSGESTDVTSGPRTPVASRSMTKETGIEQNSIYFVVDSHRWTYN